MDITSILLCPQLGLLICLGCTKPNHTPNYHKKSSSLLSKDWRRLSDINGPKVMDMCMPHKRKKAVLK